MDVELVDTLNQTWKNDKSGFGFKMLQKMGWKEDEGLGKDGSGMVTAIKVSKREIGLGLGGEENMDHAGNKAWNATSASFNSVLDVLKATYKKKESKKDKPKKSLPTVSVGMKYKKMREAKDLSTKSHSELKSILGSVPQAKKTTTVSDESNEEEARQKKSKKSKKSESDEKKDIKKKKSKK